MEEKKRYGVNNGRPENIHYESYENFGNSIFANVYERATSILEDILNNLSIKEKSGTADRNAEQIYNLISFTGGRGTGKTSTMLSFMEHLKDHYRNANSADRDISEKDMRFFVKEKSRKSDRNNKTILREIMFTGIEYINASQLEAKEDIFGVILSKMLFKLQFEEQQGSKHYNRGIVQEDDYEYKRRELMLQFNKVYNSLRALKSKDDILESSGDMYLDTIEKMSLSQNLKSDFQELVKKYLDIMRYPSERGSYAPERSYLVVSIDDLDLNIASGYQIMEQIRKYLMVPNVLILLSVNYEQVRKLCQEHYISEFSGILKYEKEAPEYVKQLSREYVEKVIPDYRKIEMPELISFEDGVEVSDGNKSGIDGMKNYFMYKLREILNLTFYSTTEEIIYIPDTLRRFGNSVKLLREFSEKFVEYDEKYKWFVEQYLNQNLGEKLDYEQKQVTERLKHSTKEMAIKYVYAYFQKNEGEKYQEFQSRLKTYLDVQPGTEKQEKLGRLLMLLDCYQDDIRYKYFIQYIVLWFSAAVERDFQNLTVGDDNGKNLPNYIGKSVMDVWDYDVFPIQNLSLVDEQNRSIKINIGRITKVHLKGAASDGFFSVKSGFRAGRAGNKLAYLQFLRTNRESLIGFQYFLLFCRLNDLKGQVRFSVNKLDKIEKIDWNPMDISFSISYYMMSVNRGNELLDQLDSSLFAVKDKAESTFQESFTEKEEQEINEMRVKVLLDNWRQKYSAQEQDNENKLIRKDNLFPLSNLQFMMNLQNDLIEEFQGEVAEDFDENTCTDFIKKYFTVTRQKFAELRKIYEKCQIKSDERDAKVKGDEKTDGSDMKATDYLGIFKTCPLVEYILSDEDSKQGRGNTNGQGDESAQSSVGFYNIFYNFLRCHCPQYNYKEANKKTSSVSPASSVVSVPSTPSAPSTEQHN